MSFFLSRQIAADADEGTFPAIGINVADGDAALAGRGMDEAAVTYVDSNVAGLIVALKGSG